MSSLAWLDFDEAERQRAQRIMALFQERESRDELGLGAIRDSISDHLFPGTSTIQTRLRYMLFVPWILRMVEVREGSPSELTAEARSLELRLVDALQDGGETLGVIGRDAGARLQRLPSAVYWAGVGSWGIRLFQGSTDGYFASIQGVQRGRHRVRESEDASTEGRPIHIWHPSLPTMPPKLLEAATFDLTTEEAQFIIDRLVASQPKTLLTTLARERVAANCQHIWEHPNFADFPAQARDLVRHAEIFSQIMHAAALIYNLELSKLREKEEWVAAYEERLHRWGAEFDLPAVRAWSIDGFWKAIDHPGHTIRYTTKRFVTEWLTIVRAAAAAVSRSQSAWRLVRDRERHLKTSQSRFSNRAARDRWRGASAVDRLSFRWPQAQSHLRDLANAK